MVIKQILLYKQRRLVMQYINGGYDICIVDIQPFEIVRLKEKITEVEEAIEKFEYFYEKLK